jgi:hypothetical protein
MHGNLNSKRKNATYKGVDQKAHPCPRSHLILPRKVELDQEIASFLDTAPLISPERSTKEVDMPL